VYALVWRLLPGPFVVKAGLAAGLLAAVVLLLFGVVFPWVEPLLPFTRVVAP
jgi:hypothetical protein